MGSKKTTTSDTKSHAVTTPNTPGYVSDVMQKYAGKISDYAGMDPFKMVAKASPLQDMAFAGGMGLGGPGGWRGALMGALGGGLQGLGDGLSQDAGAPMQQNPLSLLSRYHPPVQGQPGQSFSSPAAAPAAPVAAQPMQAQPNQQYLDAIAEQYKKLGITPYQY